jgi:HEAT repeat protein
MSIATLSRDSTARLWNRETGSLITTLAGHRGAVRTAVFQAGNDVIMTYADDQIIKTWDMNTGAELGSIPLAADVGQVISAEFNPTGTRLALGLNARSEVYDAETGQLVYALFPFGHPGLRVNTTDITFRPDGGRIATAAYSHEIAVWDTRNGDRLLNLHEHGQGATSVAYSPDMTLIASGSRDMTVIIWDARLGVVRKKLSPGWEVMAVAFSPDGATLAVVERAPRGESRRASLWDVATGTRLVRLDNFGPVRNESFSPGGDLLATPAGNSARLMKAASDLETPGSVTGTASPTASSSTVEPASESGDIQALANLTLHSTSCEQRIQAAWTLAQLGTGVDAAIPGLTDALDSDDPGVRLNGALALADIGAAASGATPGLANLLQNDPDHAVRTAAVLALGCIHTNLNIPPPVGDLTKALEDEDVRVRYHAAHALDKVIADAPEALAPLTSVALTDPTFGIRRMTAFNLGNMGETALGALPTLIEGTTSTDERQRWWASYTIWTIGTSVGELAKDAVPALKKAISDPSDYRDENGGPPMKYAIHALGGIGPVVLEVDPHIIPLLGDIMINDDDYYHRKAAALALQSILEVKGLRQQVRGYVRKTPQ